MIEKMIVPSLGFNVKAQLSPNWSTAKRRMLIFFQTVPTEDLEAGTMCSGQAWPHVLRYAQAHADRYAGCPSFAYALVNFNDKKHLHLKTSQQLAAEAEFRSRALTIIKKLDPTHIFFSGDLGVLYPEIENVVVKDGWIHQVEGRKVTASVDYARLIEAKSSHANLLGLFTRHLAYLHLGKHPHDLSGLKLVPRLVSTRKAVDALFDKLATASFVSYDTETRSLSTYNNPIYTAQFCLDAEPEVGYILPIEHPHETNPFGREDRDYIRARLREFMGAKKGPTLVTLNGAFDLRVTRAFLDLPIIYHNVWELTAGEHDLDENVQELVSYGKSVRGLANLLASYCNDHYFTAEFKKSDRGNLGQTPITELAAQQYMAMDVVCLQPIRNQQLLRAEKQDLNGKPYRPFFERHVLHQMSDTEHVLSHLKAGGSHLDVPYLRKALRADSELAKAIKDQIDEFKDLPPVRSANERLLEEGGFKSKGLFGKAASSQWVFSLNKPAHKAMLFFDVMKLKPVSTTSTGAPAVDKEFVAHYKDRNYLVALFGAYQEATKLAGTYLKGWYKRMRADADALVDEHLRADFMFFPVATGRLASADPNFQNIPARGKLAKLIKEMFSTRDGYLLIRYDYAAHEVRGWSIVSGDENLAAAFKQGQTLRQKWIKTPTDEVKNELKKKGDLHILNVYRFFKKWVEKSDPLRDAVKGVVFGVLYGKSAETLGHDTKKAELDALKQKLGAAYKAKSADLPKLEEEFQNLLDEDRTEYAQGIIDKMFQEFPKGHAWVKKMQKFAAEKHYVYSPIGRIRHLYAGMTNDKKIIRRQVRQGMNAPIQGFASEIAVKAARLLAVRYYGSLVPRMKKMLGLKGRQDFIMNRIVHDASYYMVKFEMVLPFVHLLQWATTYGVVAEYERQFGLKFTVEPEIEIEIGVRDTKSYKWDWSLDNLNAIVSQAVLDGIEQGLFTASYDEIIEKIYAPWKDRDVRTYLNKTYPLLNVDLEPEIKDACKKALALHPKSASRQG